MLVLDGVYRSDGQGLRFVSVPAPSSGELTEPLQAIAWSRGRSLERAGLITRDIENCYLDLDPNEDAPIQSLIGHSITYRIATGPRQGQKVLTLQTLRPDPERSSADVAEYSGLSLHAGVAETCRRCGGQLRVIASIEEAAVIERILTHSRSDRGELDPAHPSRAPPERELLI